MSASQWRLSFAMVFLATGAFWAGQILADEPEPEAAVEAQAESESPMDAAAAGGAEAPPVEPVHLLRQPSARLVEVLGRPTNFEFVEAPLQDVVDYLQDLHGIEACLDVKALEDVGVGPDTPITGHLKQISLAQALDLLFDRYDVTYLADGDMLRITPDRGPVFLQLHDCTWASEDQLQSLIELVQLFDATHADGGTEVTVVPYGSWLAVRTKAGNQTGIRNMLAELQGMTTAAAKTAASARPADTRVGKVD